MSAHRHFRRGDGGLKALNSAGPSRVKTSSDHSDGKYIVTVALLTWTNNRLQRMALRSATESER